MEKEKALEIAKQLEKETGTAKYVYYSPFYKSYYVDERMPLIGEWYTSDGIQHGK